MDRVAGRVVGDRAVVGKRPVAPGPHGPGAIAGDHQSLEVTRPREPLPRTPAGHGHAGRARAAGGRRHRGGGASRRAAAEGRPIAKAPWPWGLGGATGAAAPAMGGAAETDGQASGWIPGPAPLPGRAAAGAALPRHDGLGAGLDPLGPGLDGLVVALIFGGAIASVNC